MSASPSSAAYSIDKDARDIETRTPSEQGGNVEARNMDSHKLTVDILAPMRAADAYTVQDDESESHHRTLAPLRVDLDVFHGLNHAKVGSGSTFTSSLRFGGDDTVDYDNSGRHTISLENFTDGLNHVDDHDENVEPVHVSTDVFAEVKKVSQQRVPETRITAPQSRTGNLQQSSTNVMTRSLTTHTWKSCPFAKLQHSPPPAGSPPCPNCQALDLWYLTYGA